MSGRASYLFTFPFVILQNSGREATSSVTLASDWLWSVHDLGVQMIWIRLEWANWESLYGIICLFRPGFVLGQSYANSSWYEASDRSLLTGWPPSALKFELFIHHLIWQLFLVKWRSTLPQDTAVVRIWQHLCIRCVRIKNILESLRRNKNITVLLRCLERCFKLERYFLFHPGRASHLPQGKSKNMRQTTARCCAARTHLTLPYPTATHLHLHTRRNNYF